MRKKQEESRLAKEVVGKQFRLLNGEDDIEESLEAADKKSDGGEKSTWLDEVNEDPYIREASRIVVDLQSIK
jgi:hypothetical protein